MESTPTIESVSAAVVEWRKSRGQRLPVELWQRLGDLRRSHSVSEIAKATGISSPYLQKKFGKRRGGFVEVVAPAVQRPSLVHAGGITLVEVRRLDGTEIRVRFSRSSDAESFVSRLVL